MPKTAPSPVGPNEAELSTNNLHGGIIVFRVVKREIANLVLDLIRFNYVEDFCGDIRPRVPGANFGEPKRNLARLVVFVPKEVTDAI